MVTEGGVCAYNGSQWFEFDVADGLAGPVVRALDIAPNDEVWVATSTGVTRINNHTLSVNNSEIVETFNVFPNPAIESLKIELIESSNSVISIYSMAMKKIMSVEVPSGQTEVNINISELKSGMYLIKIGDEIKKIIKM